LSSLLFWFVWVVLQVAKQMGQPYTYAVARVQLSITSVVGVIVFQVAAQPSHLRP